MHINQSIKYILLELQFYFVDLTMVSQLEKKLAR